MKTNLPRWQIIAQIILVALLLIGLGIIIGLQWDQILSNLSKLSLPLAALLTVLQLVIFVLKAEAWSYSLKHAGANIPSQQLHSASSATFLVNCFVPIYLGQWLRIILLSRSTRDDMPLSRQMITADGALLYVELVFFTVLLVLLLAFLPISFLVPIGFVVVVALVSLLLRQSLRKWHDRPWAQSLHIFKKGWELGLFIFLVITAVSIQLLRFAIVLYDINDSSPIQGLLGFVGSSLAGILPIGAGPSMVGGIAVFTNLDFAQATTAALVLLSTTLLAAILYALGSLARQVAGKKLRRKRDG